MRYRILTGLTVALGLSALLARPSLLPDPKPNTVDDYMAWHTEAFANSFGNDVSLVIEKAKKSLRVYRNGEVAATYPIDLGEDCTDLADKRLNGDDCTPEGVYRVIWRRDRGETQAYRALLLDYPQWDDFSDALRLGDANMWDVVQNAYRQVKEGRPEFKTNIGGLIEIHGYGGNEEYSTDGCVALKNEHMDELFDDFGLREGATVAIVRSLD